MAYEITTNIASDATVNLNFSIQIGNLYLPKPLLSWILAPGYRLSLHIQYDKTRYNHFLFLLVVTRTSTDSIIFPCLALNTSHISAKAKTFLKHTKYITSINWYRYAAIQIHMSVIIEKEIKIRLLVQSLFKHILHSADCCTSILIKSFLAITIRTHNIACDKSIPRIKSKVS